MQHEDVKERLSAGADALRFDADAQLERLLRSRGRRVAVRRGATIALALLVALLGISIAWIARPGGSGRVTPVTPAGPTGTIAYMRVVGNGRTAEVVTASVADPTPAPLAIDRYAVYPVWSPGGSRIAVGSGQDYDTVALTVANADGSDARTIDERPLRGTASWSPDGARIAYIASLPEGLGSAVFVGEADGTGSRQILNGYWQSVSWSPEGSRLLLCGHPETGTNSFTEDGYDVYTVRPDGSSLEPVLVRDGFEHFGQWSPDGTRILFTSGPSYDDATYRSDVYVMGADGSKVRQLTTWEGFDSFPTWSADGEWIAFASDRDATPEQQRANREDQAFANISIFAMRSDGTDLREVLPAGDGETLLPGSWSD